MPTYQYECQACNYSFEKFQSMLDKKLRKCPQCGKMRLTRLIGAGSGLIFKGNGFYATDYKKTEAAPQPASSGKSDAGECQTCPAAPKCPTNTE
jgi:putative FmdB family regulatory protein